MGAPGIPVKPTRALTWAALAALILIWSTTWAVIRVGLRGIPPFTGVALRFALASAALLALAPLLGVKLGRSPNEWRIWIANSLLTFAIPYGVLYWAEQSVPSGLAAVLFATMPLIVAVAAHFALAGRAVDRARALGILIGFAGIAVIFSEDFQALGGAQVANGRRGAPHRAALRGLGSIAGQEVGGGGPSDLDRGGADGDHGAADGRPGAGRRVAAGPSTSIRRPCWRCVYLGIVGSAVPFTLYFWLLKRQTATAMSLINYATPVIAVAVGTLFMGEPFTARIAAGSALVLVGVGVALRQRT